MKIVVQRVSKAKVIAANEIISEINQGIVALVGVGKNDTQETIEWMTNKLVNLRIFSDENDKMNKSVLDILGGIILVSNFTLLGDVQKGFRPSFANVAHPDFSKPYFEQFVNYIRKNYENKLIIGEGVFGAMMNVELINDGPVTIIIEK